jgi:glycosyltransferase involved in cell wall biosynthesis
LFSPSVLAATRMFPRVITVHGPEDWTLELLSWNLASCSTGSGRLTLADRARYLYLRFLERPVYLPLIRRVDRVLTPSRYFADAVRRDVGRVPTYVVPNGINLLAPHPMPGNPHVLYVGRLERVKGVTVLVQAFAEVLGQLPEARLTLVGRGTQQREIEELVSGMGLDGSIDVCGHVSHAKLREAYHLSSLVVIPSVGPENFPTVALEALGVGRPIVGTRVGGIPELVVDGVNGLLVPPGEVDALADAMVRILGDGDLAARMAARSAESAEEYSVERFVDRMEVHYREVVYGSGAAMPPAGRQLQQSDGA